MALGSNLTSLAPAELGAIDPDAVQDDGQLAGEGNLGLLHPLALGDAHGPGLQGRPFDDATHHDVCCLVEGTSDHLVADLADTAHAIKLAGLVLSWGQAQMGADGFGSEEPSRHIDAGSVGEGDQRADARNAREPSADRIALHRFHNHAVELVVFSDDECAGSQQRRSTPLRARSARFSEVARSC